MSTLTAPRRKAPIALRSVPFYRDVNTSRRETVTKVLGRSIDTSELPKHVRLAIGKLMLAEKVCVEMSRNNELMGYLEKLILEGAQQEPKRSHCVATLPEVLHQVCKSMGLEDHQIFEQFPFRTIFDKSRHRCSYRSSWRRHNYCNCPWDQWAFCIAKAFYEMLKNRASSVLHIPKATLIFGFLVRSFAFLPLTQWTDAGSLRFESYTNPHRTGSALVFVIRPLEAIL